MVYGKSGLGNKWEVFGAQRKKSVAAPPCDSSVDVKKKGLTPCGFDPVRLLVGRVRVTGDSRATDSGDVALCD